MLLSQGELVASPGRAHSLLHGGQHLTNSCLVRQHFSRTPLGFESSAAAVTSKFMLSNRIAFLFLHHLVCEILHACWFYLKRLLGLHPGQPLPAHLTLSHADVVSDSVMKKLPRRSRPLRRTWKRRAKRKVLRKLLPAASRLALQCVRFACVALGTSWWVSCLRWLGCKPRQVAPAEVDSPSHGLAVGRPCLGRRIRPVHVNLDTTEWPTTRQADMQNTTLCALQTWCESLRCPDELLREWFTRVTLACLCMHVPICNSNTCLMGLVACVLTNCVSWEHIQSFTVITRALGDWIFPDCCKTKRSTCQSTDLLWLLLGSCRLLLFTAWQAAGGKRKQARATRRCLGLDPVLQTALLSQGKWSLEAKNALAKFACSHIWCVLCPIPGHAVLYQLASPYHEYVGSTKFGAHKTGCQGDAPVPRSYQHVLEHRKSRTPQGSRMQKTPKLRLFGHLHPADHMFCVLVVDREHHVRALEDAAIRCWQKAGNCRSTGGSKLARARHSVASRQTRLRPSFRQSLSACSCSVALHTQWFRVGQRLMESRCKPQGQLCLRVVVRLAFSQAYLHLQKHMLLEGRGFGPLDICAAGAEGLLVRYIADSRVCCWESLEARQRAWTSCSAELAIRLGHLLLKMPSCGAQQRALCKLSRWLVELGMKPARLIHVPWPLSCGSRVLWDIVRQLQKDARLRKDWASVWFCMLLRPAQTRRFTAASQWRFIALAKSFSDRAMLTCCLNELKPTQTACLSMSRAKLHWGVPTKSRVEHECCVAVASAKWLASKAYSPHAWWLVSTVKKSFFAKLQLAHTKDLHDDYLESLPVCPPNWDKDRHACWLMPASLYERWCFVMFRQDAVHWVSSACRAEHLVEVYRVLHLRQLPPHLRHYAAKSKWRHFELPYAYCTLKAKCFEEGIGRVCEKPGHSCLRRIVSWSSHPAKTLYRGVSRAIIGLIWVLGVGFETRMLHTAVSDLRSACQQLLPPEKNKCCRCDAVLHGLSLIVCDAAQMYEEISPQLVLEAVQSLIFRAQARYPNATGVAVAKARRLHCWIAEGTFRKRPNCRVWLFSDILTVLDLALKQPHVRLGKFLFEQVRGVPIGGHMSKAIASAVLAVEELRWCEDRAKQLELGFATPEAHEGPSFQQLVAMSRYVDDTALVSKCVCPSCLSHMPDLMYRKPICFESTPPAALGHPWLDVWLFDEKRCARNSVQMVSSWSGV